jgi:hypothetical protein
MPEQDSTPAEGQAPEATADTPKPESTEPQFDKEYVSKIRSEAADWRIKAQQATEKLEEYEEQNASELEKAQKQAAKAQSEAQAAKTALLKYEVAAEKQVPQDAWDLLTGSTREELEAKADKLLTLVKSRTDTDTKPDFDGGAREPAPDADPATAHNREVLKLLGIST